MTRSVFAGLLLFVMLAPVNSAGAQEEMFGLPKQIWDEIPENKREALCGRSNRKLRREAVWDAVRDLAGPGNGRTAGGGEYESRNDWIDGAREVRRFWGRYCRNR